jgi:autotransporter-associated beta strand protein
MKPNLTLFITTISFAIGLQISYAGSATWNLNARASDWSTPSDWTPRTVPNGPDDVATYATSSVNTVSVSAAIEVNSIIFNPGGDAFTITANSTFTLTISGAGITNNSGIAQNFVTAAGTDYNEFGTITFTGAASAGSQTVFTNKPGTAAASGSGHIYFFSTSTAGNGTFVNQGSAETFGGETDFYDSSSAGDGIFTNQSGGVFAGVTAFYDTSSAGNATVTNIGSGTQGGSIRFHDNSTAGNAAITANGAPLAGTFGSDIQFLDFSSAGDATVIANGGSDFTGVTGFYGSSTAGNATLICKSGPADTYGGSIAFYYSSSGGTARIEVLGKGRFFLDQSRDIPKVAIGSLEGDGLVFLEGNALRVGGNNLSTVFSGIIQDGPYGGVGGSLTKTGRGVLILTNSNSYPGGTVIKHGGLLVNNTGGSGTGSGPVQVDSGTLAGKGIVTGAVTIGTGSGPGATLTPGSSGPGVFVIQNTLVFNSDATYHWSLSTPMSKGAEVMANGVTINSGAHFSVFGVGGGTFPPGTEFTVINNTAETPIGGAFSNLPDGSAFTVGGSTFQANYEGGTGNDLTLTVQ